MMNSHSSALVTVFAGGATDTGRPEHGPLATVLQVVTGEHLRAQTRWIRTCFDNGDIEAAGEAKNGLPVELVSRTFS
jgi:hypothetical protein